MTCGAVVVAVVRERLYDIDRLLPTTVVAVALGLLVLAVDALVLLVAGAAFGSRDSALLAVAVVAVLYTPLRSRLWRAARRLTRGSRDDPYAAVSTLAGRLETAVAPGEQLAALARSVAEAFKLPYVRVEIDRADGARAVVEHGHTDRPTLDLPIRYRDETDRARGGGRGTAPLRVRPAPPRRPAAPGRAAPPGPAPSPRPCSRRRADLVTAREEERRRLRRDLHDSLGPGLGAVTLRVETARGLAARDPERADAVLEQAVGDIGTLLTDVRRLVHDLRPPALDELGLLGALRTQARRLSTERLTITVDGDPGELGRPDGGGRGRRVPDRLRGDDQRGAARRGDPRRVLLERRDDRLVVTVADDGRGIRRRRRRGGRAPSRCASGPPSSAGVPASRARPTAAPCPAELPCAPAVEKEDP